MTTGVPPADDDRRPDSAARRVDAACDRYEAAWREGRNCRIEDVVGAAAEPERPALLRELIVLEAELRRCGGEHPTAREYRDRFPGRTACVDAAFAETGLTSGASGPRSRLTRDDASRILDYEILGELGHGGMGVVFRAFDRRRGEVVALKALSRLGPSAVDRFKREFRALVDMAHHNLAALYELVSDGHCWFFTMELVDGVDFLAYVRAGRDTHRVDRLRNALYQLVDGVMALHEGGLLHRDLKPPNVLITRSDRVVILDFGLAAGMDLAGWHHSTSPHVLGTVAYMAPEQAAGAPVSAVADWYSVGVMLYEALTGRLPISGSPVEVMAAKQMHEPPPPRELASDIPEDLNELCVGLLRRDPAERLLGPEILRRLGSRSQPPKMFSAPPQSSLRRATLLVGRQRHLDALSEAYSIMVRGKAVVRYLHGLSGAGKTTLVHHFLEGLIENDGVIALTGRCYERESVPYKALDSLIDSLARYLAHLSSEEVQALIPRDVLSLARVFPVLRRVDAVANARGRGFEAPDPKELRRRGFAALRELLARLGDRRPLVLFVDDLQWGDADSAALLEELLRPPDPPTLLLLGAYRAEDAATAPFLRALQGLQLHAVQTESAVDHRELVIEPLCKSEAEALARALLGCESSANEANAEMIARESGGNPFFVHELVRYLRSVTDPVERLSSAEELTLDEVLWERVVHLPAGSRRLLEVVAVSGRPLEQAEACRAAELGAEGRTALAYLRSGRLVRSTGPGDQDQIETYHDRIRQSVIAHLTTVDLERHHRRLALVLEASGRSDPEVLGTHFREGGEPDRAGFYYSAAGDQAAEALAFDRAVGLYRLVFEHQPLRAAEVCRLRIKLGDALANAGRGPEAAREYLAAAAATGVAEALELKRRGAMQLLTSGHVDEGLAALRMVLREVGMKMPDTPRGALFSLLFRQAQVRLRGLGFRPCDVSQVPDEDLTRIDICWAAVAGLIAIDPIRGSYFQAMNLLYSLRAGELHRIVRALAMEAIRSSTNGWTSRHRTHKILHTTDDLSRRIAQPYAIGVATLANGVSAYLEGHWRTGLELTDRADGIFRDHCTGVAWELDTARSFSLWSLTRMGAIAELSRRWPGLISEGQDRHNIYIKTNVNTHVMCMLKLSEDDPEGAEKELHYIMTQWSRQGCHVQHNEGAAAGIETALYRGQGVAAWEGLTRYWPTLEGSLLLRVQVIRIFMHHLRARCALAAAAQTSACGPLLRVADREARRLRRQQTPYAEAMAHLIHAGTARHRGDLDGAVTWLDAAVARFDAVEMSLYAAAARRRLGEILCGHGGRDLVDTADAWMGTQGIKDPARMTALFAPGFPDCV